MVYYASLSVIVRTREDSVSGNCNQFNESSDSLATIIQASASLTIIWLKRLRVVMFRQTGEIR